MLYQDKDRVRVFVSGHAEEEGFKGCQAAS